ncbi:MAG: enoyl-CoA hydratase-related protein [Deltaproteobacteria bacterium]|jgi:enoyl-CoA hydratase/carnithine racemase|nr:enoyl-CoA hydratase-related protein [Deltaproteobacteria bacterium]
MAYQSISLTTEAGVGLIMLNRPEALNAVNDAMRIELTEALCKLESDPEIRVLVVSGSGKAFSAGADLRHIKLLYEEFRRFGHGTQYGGPELARAFFAFPKPMIAAINGVAVGWGMTMPLACDIRIASTQARFSAAFVRAGLTPEFGSTYLLPRLIGYGRAAELVFTGRMLQAEEALEIGLVNRLVPHEELMTESMSLARCIAGQPLEALIKSKGLLRRGLEAVLEQWIEYEALVFRECMTSEEHYQAVVTLLGKMDSKEK